MPSGWEYLGDWTPSPAQRRVRDALAELFGVEPHRMVGAGRWRPLVEYRHTAIWVVKQCFPALSNAMAGRLFGGRDHSTVINSCRQVENRRARDPEYAALTDALVEGFGVEQTGFAMAQIEWDRVATLCAGVAAANARERPAPAKPAIPEAAARTVKPKNNFAPTGEREFALIEKDDANVRRGSEQLAEAMAREGMVCR